MRKSMWIAVFGIVLFAIGVTVFFRLPASPFKERYQAAIAGKIGSAPPSDGVFAEADIRDLPPPVGRYFRHCGYLGTPKMSYMLAELRGVDFVMSENRTIQIDYRQINLALCPERFALISSSILGIPFEGLDSFENGRGSMKGQLAKLIPLFDQTGEEMDSACLVTWLAECLMVPNAALQDFVTWEPIDDTRAKALISWEGVSAGGEFCFSDEGELLAFHTDDRAAIEMDGTKTEAPWSAYFHEYRRVDGILRPAVIQSVWHYETGDCVYFNQNKSPIHIQYHA